RVTLRVLDDEAKLPVPGVAVELLHAFRPRESLNLVLTSTVAVQKGGLRIDALLVQHAPEVLRLVFRERPTFLPGLDRAGHDDVYVLTLIYPQALQCLAILGGERTEEAPDQHVDRRRRILEMRGSSRGRLVPRVRSAGYERGRKRYDGADPAHNHPPP